MAETSLTSGVADVDDGEIRRLEAEIVSKRARVVTSVGELRERLHHATSWRGWVAAHPVAWIGAGVCLGLIVGYGVRRGRRLDRVGPGQT